MTSVPQEVMQSIHANGVALKGTFRTPLGSPQQSLNVQLRRVGRVVECTGLLSASLCPDAPQHAVAA
jgi:isocitrate dehydrogenase